MLLDDTLNMHERLSHPPFPSGGGGEGQKEEKRLAQA
jgi:hypothetical protein